MSAEERVFFHNAVLDTILPDSSNATISQILENKKDVVADDNNSLLSIKQREHLFFDERLRALVVLQVASSSRDALNDYLPRLDIKLDIHITDAPQPNQQNGERHEGNEKELILSTGVKTDQDPFIAFSESGTSSDHGSVPILVIWDVEAVLHRPRRRLSKRAVTFAASASLKAATSADGGSAGDQDLPSLEPAPANIVDALRSVPALKSQAPCTPASGIWKVRPGPRLDLETLHIGQLAATCLPISPAVSARIRCSRLSTSSARQAMVACLDFEVTPFVYFDVLLTEAKISLGSEGHIESLSPLEMPITCRARDIITFLWKIQPSSNPPRNPLPHPSSTHQKIGLLDIHLESTLKISPQCQPKITMNWRSTVDFSTPPDTRAPPTGHQQLPRLNRPNDTEYRSSSVASGLTTPLSVSRPTFLPTGTQTTNPTTGLTMSFTVPSTVILGRHFTMSVTMTNHTPRPLKLILIPITRRPPSSSSLSSSSSTLLLPPPHRHAQKSSSTSTSASSTATTPATAIPDRTSHRQRHSANQSTSSGILPSPPQTTSTNTAPAVVDEKTLYALQTNNPTNSNNADADLIPLSTDVRVGPIGTGSCHEVGIKMVAMKVGVWKLDAVRVVDLIREPDNGPGTAAAGAGAGGNGSGVTVVRGELLPEVVVVMEADEGQGREGQKGRGQEGTGE